MIFSSLGSNLGAGAQSSADMARLSLPDGKGAAGAREGDTYAWLVRKVVCPSRCNVVTMERVVAVGEAQN